MKSVGGPCRLVSQGESAVPSAPTIFTYAGRTWYSVEQCYQAMKFTDDGSIDNIAQQTPNPNESSKDYGVRMWREGRHQYFGSQRNDWEEVKYFVMYTVCCAKYEQHPD